MIWQRYPLFRVFLAYVSGILLAHSVQIPFHFWLGLFGILVPAVLLTAFSKKLFFDFQRRKWFGALAPLVFFALGGLSLEIYFGNHTTTDSYDLGEQKSYFLVTLLDDPIPKDRSFGSKVRVEKVIQNDQKMELDLTAMLYLQKSQNANQLHYGDQLIVFCNLQKVAPPMNPNQFDYQRYLKLKSIYHQAYADSSSWQKISERHGNFLIAAAKKFRRNALGVINSWEMPADEKSVAKALLLGYRNDIQDELRDAYSSTGAVHVLAVSGLHVGILYIILSGILFFLKNRLYGPQIRAVILIGFLWFFAMVTGLSSSVVRAATMFTFVAFGAGFRRKTSVHNTILGSAMLLMFFRPTFLFDVGFQLSYCAVFGIVWLQPKLASFWKPRFWIVKQFWAITTVSIAAQIGTFPLALFYFHQFPTLFLVSNWAVIPLVTVLMYLGLLTLGTTSIPKTPQWSEDFLVNLYSTFLRWMNQSVNWVNSQSKFLIDGIDIQVFEMALLYVFILAFGTWLTFGNFRRLALAGLAICALLFSQFIEKQSFTKNAELVVYSVRNQSGIGLFHGKGAVFIADSSLINDEKTMGFNIETHWWARGAESVKQIGFEENFQNDFFAKTSNFSQFYDSRIFFYKENLTIPAADFWIVNENNYPPKEISKELIPQQIILSGGLSYYQRKRWKEWAASQNIPIWDVLEKGAFQLKKET